ncbi:hypothetical protein DM872_22235 [Pseudomonas taiwanensis]|uniref:hypothetical protein n=1 Tax=Pseudomonas taiwanensis TaxID=470150 RepID=UPI0015B7F20F|nr:hypothetical protein [Pseudomonas taiwanensis]NWL79572.1 hypothetical protein [Pseudomonas taiwanensis]
MKPLSAVEARRLAEAVRYPFAESVTAYVTDAQIVACCCLGIVYRHLRADRYGRFQDGHRIRTSDIHCVVKEGPYWILHTVNKSRYVVVTFSRPGGRKSLDDFLNVLVGGFHITPKRLQ